MGTWGAGPFENDEALDFLGEVQEQGVGRLGALARPLEHVAYSGDYLEAFDVSEAIAAAALIGAVLNPSAAAEEPYLPEWVGSVDAGDIDNELIHLARQALRRALQPHENELFELWNEEEGATDWQQAVARVLGWLGDRDD